ncbi:hypothetical protein A2U01_0011883 [Trifolium medium]|uniref:Uncharacterized protein n=1 Tax=Trifolium medium TaxID=97028 RepID=A0A392MVG9_9FABA|nr:hypothetical protein [Trifolium medium]
MGADKGGAALSAGRVGSLVWHPAARMECEDTCLFEDESDSEASQSDNEAGHKDPDVCCNVDLLVEKITNGLEDEKQIDLPKNTDEGHADKPDDNLSIEGGVMRRTWSSLMRLRPP